MKDGWLVGDGVIARKMNCCSVIFWCGSEVVIVGCSGEFELLLWLSRRRTM